MYRASFERILDEATGAVARANYTSITEVETPNDRTVVLQLDGPRADSEQAWLRSMRAILRAAPSEAGPTTRTEFWGPAPIHAGGAGRPNATMPALPVFETWPGGEIAL